MYSLFISILLENERHRRSIWRNDVSLFLVKKFSVGVDNYCYIFDWGFYTFGAWPFSAKLSSLHMLQSFYVLRTKHMESFEL